jgi:hypothetical protein
MCVLLPRHPLASPALKASLQFARTRSRPCALKDIGNLDDKMPIRRNGRHLLYHSETGLRPCVHTHNTL